MRNGEKRAEQNVKMVVDSGSNQHLPIFNSAISYCFTECLPLIVTYPPFEWSFSFTLYLR